MDGYPWVVHEVGVRCPCGMTFKAVDTYLQHKVCCVKHQAEIGVKIETSANIQRCSITSAKAPTTISMQKPRSCLFDLSFKGSSTAQKETSGRSARKQSRNSRSATPTRDSDVRLTSLKLEQSSSSVQPTNRIACACGRTFAEQAALDMHLQFSKAHRVEESHLAEGYISLTPDTVQITALEMPPPPASRTSAPIAGDIPCSTVHISKTFRCTCGHLFETECSLHLHKRNSLYHRRHADESKTNQKDPGDSLTSAFASMNLSSGPAWLQPSVARLTCIRGCIFSTQGAFDQHNTDAARYAWLADREVMSKTFGARFARR